MNLIMTPILTAILVIVTLLLCMGEYIVSALIYGIGWGTAFAAFEYFFPGTFSLFIGLINDLGGVTYPGDAFTIGALIGVPLGCISGSTPIQDAWEKVTE